MRRLIDHFLDSTIQRPDAPAIWIAGATTSYIELARAAASIARLLHEVSEVGQPCAIFSNKTLVAYSGLLATQMCGRAYIPLHPNYPPARTLAMIECCAAPIVITSRREVATLIAISRISGHLFNVVIVPDAQRSDIPADAQSIAQHVLAKEDLSKVDDFMPCLSEVGEIAYVMFTSGSTGAPKGVAVGRSGVEAYLSSIGSLLNVEPEDRCTGLFDLTFDLSVHDTFVTWSAGACLYVFRDIDFIWPLEVVRHHRITRWFSVPTVAAMGLARTTMGAQTTLRTSAFCGEALPTQLARDWLEAAPGSRLFNLYGPTEATIAVTAYEADRASLPLELATVPIGHPLPGQECLVIDQAGEPCVDGSVGELLVGGSQLALGYLGDPNETARRFIEKATSNSAICRWYQTGDFVRQEGTLGLVFVGRKDFQVKVNGYRIELLEVEAALRKASGRQLVAAHVWGGNAMAIRMIVGFVVRLSEDQTAVIKNCAELLPAFMVPRRVISLDTMPLTVNGKIDRYALGQLVAQEMSKATSQA